MTTNFSAQATFCLQFTAAAAAAMPFSLASASKPGPHCKPSAPRASDVKPVPSMKAVLASAKPFPDRFEVPGTVFFRLGRPAVILGLDIETHDWVDLPPMQETGRQGQFGWRTSKPESSIRYPRVVQLGWAVKHLKEGCGAETKARYVLPDGFIPSDKTALVQGYGSGQELMSRLQKEGRPLKEVLLEFMADARDVIGKGGQLVAHHVEFDAGVLFEELGRCGLGELQPEWKAMAENSYCTMNEWLATEVKGACGVQGSYWRGLGFIGPLVVPEIAKELLLRHHDAGADAQLACEIYAKLLESAILAPRPGQESSQDLPRSFVDSSAA